MDEYELALWAAGKRKGLFGGLLCLWKEKTWRRYVVKSSAAALFLGALLYAAGLSLHHVLLVSAAILAFCISIPFIVASAGRDDIEKNIIPALYFASRIPDGATTTQILSKLSGAEFGLLGSVFKEIHLRYSKSAGRHDAAAVMKDVSRKIGSSRLERFLQVFVLNLESGKNLPTLFLKSAEDAEDMDELHKQKAASLSMQKYTILASGAVFVPFMLGITVRISTFLSKLNDFDVGRVLFAYTILNAVVVSIWTALAIDERPASIFAYAPALVLSCLAFYKLGGNII